MGDAKEEGLGAAPDASQGAAGAALREELPPFRGQSVRAASLDMLVELDEPEQVVLELGRIAKTRPKSERWEIVGQICRWGTEHFERYHVARKKE